MADEGPKRAAVAETIGLAVSLIPIAPCASTPREGRGEQSRPGYADTVTSLALYVGVVAGFLLLLGIE
jgi:hypothetical protein